MTRPRLLVAAAVLAVWAAPPVAIGQQNPPNVRVVRGPGGPNPFTAGDAAPDKTLTDDQALAAAGLAADDPAGVLNYLRQRTLSDADLSKIQAVIRRLGADDFEDRLRAAREVELFGPAAVGPLRAASQSDPDAEVLYRAGECLRRLEKVPHAAVAAAAARVLARAKPPGAAGVLLAFLPVADSERVADDIRTALTAFAYRDGAFEPAFVAALTGPSSARRAAAAGALIAGAPTDRLADLAPKLTAAAAAEPDVEAKFQILFALTTIRPEKALIGSLIDLIPDLPRGRLWQAEDYLLQLAGPAAPKVVLGKTRPSLDAGRAAWKGWWDGAAAGTDLGAFRYTPRIAGKTVLVMMDYRYGSAGVVSELGPDLKEKWKVPDLRGPMDARFLPDGTFVTAELNGNSVLTRDTAGRVLAARRVGGNNRGGGVNRVAGSPQQLQVLENGNLLVVCRNVVVEWKKDTTDEVMQYVRNQGDVVAARRLADGRTLVLVQNGPRFAFFLDEKGVEVPNLTLPVRMPYFTAAIDAPAADRVLVTETNRVVEYDLKDGKSVWEKAVNQPRSVQRLPNGNTLVVAADGPTNKLLEFAPSGEEVWSYAPTNGLQLFRAYRR